SLASLWKHRASDRSEPERSDAEYHAPVPGVSLLPPGSRLRRLPPRQFDADHRLECPHVLRPTWSPHKRPPEPLGICLSVPVGTRLKRQRIRIDSPPNAE